jgi:hypothetical protein
VSPLDPPPHDASRGPRGRSSPSFGPAVGYVGFPLDARARRGCDLPRAALAPHFFRHTRRLDLLILSLWLMPVKSVQGC